MISQRSLSRVVALGVLIAAASGCSSLGFQVRSPITRVSKETRFGPGKLTAAAVQSELMSSTDTFDAVVAEQWNRVAAEGRALSDPKDESTAADLERGRRLRRAAIENKLATVSAALSIASSPNPNVALADMIVMITLQRMVLETPAALERYGEELSRELIAAYREQEERVWRIAARAMTAAQRRQLRELIAAWRAENPDTNYVANVRLEDFAKARQQTFVDNGRSGDSLLALVALDPLAGLDPAQREVQKSRMLGERVFFYGSRMPQVLKWQVESLSQDLLRAPEIERVSDSMETVTESVERFTAVAERLPDELRGTLGEVRETAEAADAAAKSLTVTLNAADAFAARFDDGDDAPGDPDVPARDALAEYRAAVAQTGDTADRLSLLARDLDERSGALQSAAGEVQSRAKDVIQYAFVRLLVLVLAAPFAVALAMLLYRRAHAPSGTRSRPRDLVAGRP